jgi:CubicO group peptidase (beta-lactamase class C family)
MKAVLVALAIFSLGVAPIGVCAASLPSNTAFTFGPKVDAVVEQSMKVQSVPGVSIAIARDGVIEYAKGYGYADTAEQKPVDPATYFEIGSITKQFTTAAIALLVRDGKLQFDQRVSTILPDAPHAAEITIRQLMTHTSGLPEFLANPQAAPFLYSTTAKPADIYGLEATQPLNFQPGVKYEYSNTNYVILGAIIEKISGMTYGQFLRKRILDGTPFAGISYGVPAGTTAHGYNSADDKTALPIWSSNVTYAAGALYSTASDLTRWDDAFFKGRVVPQPMVAELTTPVSLPATPQNSYAAGWIAGELDEHKEIWHNGGLPGFNTRNAYFPAERLAIVVLGNTVKFDESAIVKGVFRTLYPPTAAQLAVELQSAPGEDPAVTARVRDAYAQFAALKLDRTQYAPAAVAALTDAIVTQVGSQLSSLGTPTAFVYLSKIAASGSTAYVYRVVAPGGNLRMTASFNPDGKIDGIYFAPI